MALESGLHLLPRFPLVPVPTPLERLERFSAELGVEVWMKRDDIGSPALAGNKARKLELLIGEARRVGADTLITSGAAQSNSARASAAAAARAGMRCILVLRGEAPPEPTGNLILDALVGAELRFVGDRSWTELEEAVDDIGGEVRSAGGTPVTAPVGCSSPLGSLGFALAYEELAGQLAEEGLGPERIYHASTSGGTHAGLALGRALAEDGPRARAVAAGVLWDDPVEHHRELARAAGRLIGVEIEPDIDVEDGHVGPGYGVPTSEAVDAIRLLARTEGIVCDPVYSGKGLAGLVADAGRGWVSSPVVFWHTGGWQAVFHPPFTEALLAD